MKLASFFLSLVLAAPALADSPGIVLQGKDGIGKGKHIVLISGDQEYRSEEAIPQLAKCQNLRKLDLRGTKVTAEGAAQLTKLLPNCQILH